MTRVLVVHHDIDIADQEVDSLRRAGYEVVECIGPTGATRPCPVLRGNPCQMADGADVLIYDVWADGGVEGSHSLVAHLREQYPEKAVVLTSIGLEPDWAEGELPPRVTTLVGAPTRDRLVNVIEAALRHPAA